MRFLYLALAQIGLTLCALPALVTTKGLNQLQLNPALYLSNASGHKLWGYAVLTWNIDTFAPRPAQPPAPATLPKSQGQADTPPKQ